MKLLLETSRFGKSSVSEIIIILMFLNRRLKPVITLKFCKKYWNLKFYTIKKKYSENNKLNLLADNKCIPFHITSTTFFHNVINGIIIYMYMDQQIFCQFYNKSSILDKNYIICSHNKKK